MRTVVENTLVSADGITGSPPTWTGGLFAAEAAATALRQLARTDAMLMGRSTYELFAGLWGAPTDPYGQALHDLRKLVFSSTLERVDWHGAELVRGRIGGGVYCAGAGATSSNFEMMIEEPSSAS